MSQPNVAIAVVQQRAPRCIFEDSGVIRVPSVFTYNAICAGSNYAPLLLEARDSFGNPVDFTGATVTVLIKDQRTGLTIVQDGVAAVAAESPYWLSYELTPEVVGAIAEESTWLVEWTIAAAGSRMYRTHVPFRLPVRPKL